jgi:hypothetical protein
MKRHATARTFVGALALVIGYGLAGVAGSAGAAVAAPASPLGAGGLPGLLPGSTHSVGSGLLPVMNTSNAPVVGTQQAELYSVDGQVNGEAGAAVSISGSLAAVGAPYETANGNASQGVVYIFAKSGSTWYLQAAFTAAGGVANDEFGASVALAGSTLVVSAPFHTVNGNGNQGAAYVITESSGRWSQTAVLTAGDGTAGSRFGQSVSISGSTIAVGDPFHLVGGNSVGTVYEYAKSGSAWVQKAEIESPDLNDDFGYSVGISGSTMAIGVPARTQGSNTYQGEADVFALVRGVWTKTASFVAPDGLASDDLGVSVSISGSIVVAAAYGHDSNRGSAYVLVKSGSSWIQQTELAGGDSATGDLFGFSLSLSGSILVVGAPNHMVGTNAYQGAAYVFTDSRGVWTQTAELTASDGNANDSLGVAVSDSGGTALVGAPGHTVGSNAYQGAAYVFAS